MARNEADRDDLFGEATALVRRAELAVPGIAEPIVAGFRRDGGLSLYFGADPVYHFDVLGRLRRAYRAGRLYRTQGATLAELTRERTPTQTVLCRRDLRPVECETFVAEMRALLACLEAQIERGKATVVRQTPPDDKTWVETQLVAAIHRPAQIDETHAAAFAPRLKGKR